MEPIEDNIPCGEMEKGEGLSRYLRSTQQSADSSLFRNYMLFVAITIGLLVILTICVCFLQVYCKRYFGINCCPGAGNVTSRSVRLERIRAYQQASAAAELQQQLEEEAVQQNIQEKRLERRKRYKGLLVHNTMVVSKSDLIHEEVPKSPSRDAKRDIESHEKNLNLSEAFVLALPVKDACGKSRHVAGHCAVCIAEYEPGDHVVWSTSKSCPHVFHEECILMWLSKGKKRCPICRNVFVPSSNVTSKDNKETANGTEGDRTEQVHDRGIESDGSTLSGSAVTAAPTLSLDQENP